MLTLKLITEQTERVIAGLEKKCFRGAREAIAEVIEIDKQRRAAQTQLDKNLSDAKKLAAEIGALMKQGKKDEAEGVKAKVAEMTKTEAAKEIGKAIAERAIAKGCKAVIFDRGGYIYTGRVAALAEGAREGGLEF